jgi:multiple sugar transport system substrate-binding protein
LVIDDPDLAKAVEREWVSVGGDPLTIRHVTQEEFVGQQQRRLASDAVIFPSSLLGDLAGRDWLQPLGDAELNDPRLQRRDIWDAIRLHETNWGGQTIAVPLGSPTFVLMYREDIFSRLGLSPPRTWAEYRDLAERLNDRQVLGDKDAPTAGPWSGTCEPTGIGWGAEWLLARAASYARHRSQYSTLFDYSDLRPLVDGPPFVRALEEMAAAAKFCPPGSARDPASVRSCFLQGQCAMAVTWLVPAGGQAASDRPPQWTTGFRPLPGSPEAYNYRTRQWDPRLSEERSSVPLIGFAGRLGAVTRESRDASQAITLLAFASSTETSVRCAAASEYSTLFRESQLTQLPQWVGPPFSAAEAGKYAETLREIFATSNSLTTLRIPGRHRYMSALDQAVRRVLEGAEAPGAALSAVAAQWQEITDSIGRDTQRRAYVQSIGLRP